MIASDCYIESINSWYTSLKCLEGKTVNFDELDYLAKRLESYNEYEAAQFQSVVALRKHEATYYRAKRMNCSQNFA